MIFPLDQSTWCLGLHTSGKVCSQPKTQLPAEPASGTYALYSVSWYYYWYYCWCYHWYYHWCYHWYYHWYYHPDRYSLSLLCIRRSSFTHTASNCVKLHQKLFNLARLVVHGNLKHSTPKPHRMTGIFDTLLPSTASTPIDNFNTRSTSPSSQLIPIAIALFLLESSLFSYHLVKLHRHHSSHLDDTPASARAREKNDYALIVGAVRLGIDCSSQNSSR